ncbi:serine hydrolase domain-containing protein [Paenibacillus sp. NPDC058071]|uniref:serine hydrolase domain-containing protein n=1 Tax=Paenibacillus sp. NPDC058071 TaxID=3346326 RepID=UPI0036D8900E
MQKEIARSSIEAKLKKIVDSSVKSSNTFLLIHSDKLDIHWNMAFGQSDKEHAIPEQPYHTASIAKSFTAAIIAILVEEGKLTYSDPITKYLPATLLEGLHTYKGTDYSSDIRIEHLVSNTSGLADYFEGKTRHGQFTEVLLNDPKRVWTPEETIEWTKQYLPPRFSPGNGTLYTNTGFNLLGLVIENVTSKSYHEVLHEYLFQRLNMEQSYLSHYTEPLVKSPLSVAKLSVMGKQIDVEEHLSFTSIFAAGQAVSTSEDLLKFIKALNENRLVPKEHVAQMMQWKKMRVGIDYGYGLMRVRMFLFSQKYNVWGHLGSMGSFMLYNPGLDVYLVGSFNKAGSTGPCIRFLFHVLRTLEKCD